jgi:hypothetical protein
MKRDDLRFEIKSSREETAVPRPLPRIMGVPLVETWGRNSNT